MERHLRDLRTPRGPRMRPLTRQVLTFDLADQADALRREEGWQKSGHSAKTLVKHRDLRTVLIAMKQGTLMAKHQTGGSISIAVLSGHLRIHVGRQTLDAPAGSLVALERALPHDVEAREDSTCVLAVSAPPSKRRTR